MNVKLNPFPIKTHFGLKYALLFICAALSMVATAQLEYLGVNQDPQKLTVPHQVSYNGTRPKLISRLPNANGLRSVTCDTDLFMDYSAYNEVTAAAAGLGYEGNWNDDTGYLYDVRLSSFLTQASGDSGYLAYVGEIFDSLAFGDINNNTLAYLPMATSTIYLDSLGMIGSLQGDSTKMTKDSLLLFVYSVTGGVISTNPVKTIVYGGWAELRQFYQPLGYISYFQVPIKQQFSEGEGFLLFMEYLNKTASSTFNLLYSYEDSCGTVYIDNQGYSSPAYPSPFQGDDFWGNIVDSTTHITVVDYGDNTGQYQGYGFPVNCSYVYPQNLAFIPIITVCSNSAQAEPTVVTTAASNITGSSATINGTVNANGASTSTLFDWGLTNAYGNTVAGSPATVSGSTTTDISASLTGLAASTTYHYRLTATNTGGTADGADMTFTTAGAESCTPNANVTSGFSPEPYDVPCIVQGQSFSQTFTFVVPTYFTYLGDSVDITSLTVDSITNLPSGLTWSASNTPPTYLAGSRGCVILYGTTSAPCGEYMINIYVTVMIDGQPFTFNSAAEGYPQEYLQVISAGHGCPMLDTTQTESFVADAACGVNLAISAAISQKTDVACYGQSTGSATVTATGGNGYTYSWSNGQTTATINGLVAGTYSVTVYSEGASATASTDITQPASAVSALISSTTPSSCSSNTGGAVADASGGTPGYRYSWSNGQTGATLSNVGAGAYTVIATDNAGCTASAVANVASDATYTVSVTPSNVTCYGQSNGSATATTSGATGNISYSWSNGSTSSTASGLSAGTITVTVTDGSGCAVLGSATITQPASAVSVIAAAQGSQCSSNTGSATAIASGGKMGVYTYLWSNAETGATITNLGAGQYTVTALDSVGCSASASATVVAEATFNVSVTSDNILCYGSNSGTATAATSGTIGTIIYLWSNNATTKSISNLGPGNFSVTVTDGSGCSKSGSTTITQPATGMTVEASATPTSCSSNSGTASATPTGGAPNYNYLWSSGSTSAQVSGLAAGVYDVTVTDANGCTASASATVGSAASYSLTTSSTNVTCYGQSTGSATATVVGGNGTVSYSWNNGGTTATISNLAAGTYVVTVSDASGCAKSDAAAVTQPSTPLDAIATSTPSTCGASSGSASVTVTGNNGAPSYLWNNPSASTTSTITNLSEGIYSVTVTAGGCSATSSVSVNNSNGPSIILLTSDPTCFNATNGSVSTVVTGGTPPYQYKWSNSSVDSTISGLSAGIFTLVVTDASSCQATEAATLVQPNQLLFSNNNNNSTVNNVTCYGDQDGSIILQVSGGTPPYGYSWSYDGLSTSTINDLPSGPYIVTVTDANSCTATDNFTVTEPSAALSASASATASSDTNGTAMVTVSGGTAPYGYSWNNGATVESIINLVPGNYTVTVSDRNGCSTTATATVVTGIADVTNMISDVNLFPNPANESITIFVQLDHARAVELKVTDITGKLIYTDAETVNGSLNHQLNLSQFPSGVYILEVSAGQQSVRKRFVVTH